MGRRIQPKPKFFLIFSICKCSFRKVYLSRISPGEFFLLAPSARGLRPQAVGGENLAAIRSISGYCKVLSLRPFGAPPSQREA